MQAYSGFAQVYDEFMDNIPYEEWASYVIELLQEYGVNDGLVLELGCGTGNITEQLAMKNYDMIGIDNSEEMLSIAMEKKYEYEIEENGSDKRLGILYLLQDMREFELYGTVNAVVSICDSLNYIMSEEDLVKVFRLVNNYLEAGGIFIFDLNTEYKYKTILGTSTIAENREDCSFIWDNYYSEQEKINEYQLTVYVKEEGEVEDNLFVRYDELHYQKAYSIEKIKELLKKANMEFVTVYDAFTKEAPKEDSERVYIVAREKRQENKYYI